MKITIKELRDYIRNALSPSVSDRKQMPNLGSNKPELGSPNEVFSDLEYLDDVVDDPGKMVINDPYVTQDGPSPSAGRRKFGIS